MAKDMDAYYESDTPSERNSLERHQQALRAEQNDYSFPLPPRPATISPPPERTFSPLPRKAAATPPPPRSSFAQNPPPVQPPKNVDQVEPRERSRSRGPSADKQRLSETFYHEKLPRTFYRESMPPRYVPALLEALNDETIQPPPTPPPPPRRNEDSPSVASLGGRVCGCSAPDRKTLLILLFIITFAVVGIGVGVGVGIGVGQKNQDVASANGNSSSTTSTTQNGGETTTISVFITSTPGGMPTTTTSQTTVVIPSHTTTPPVSSPSSGADCPTVNGTSYDAANGKQFRRLCGLDFSGPGSATDIGQVSTKTMTDCIDICAGFYGCTGCSWGPEGGNSGGQYGCFLKASLITAHSAAASWQFAELL